MFLVLRKSFFFTLAFSSLLLCLFGCLTPKPPILKALPHEALDIAQEEALEDPVFIPGDYPGTDWWSYFNDPQLEQLILQSLHDNPTLTAAEARFHAARAVANGSGAYVYPQLEYDVDITSIKNSPNGIFGVLNKTDPTYPIIYFQQNMDIQLTYEFDFFKKHRNEFLATLSEARALHIESYAARLTISIAVAQSYFKLQILKLRELLAEQLVRNKEQILAITQNRLNGGLESYSNVTQSSNAILSTKQTRLQILQAKADSFYELQALLAGDFLTCIDDVDFCEHLEPFPLPQSLPLDLLAHRPDVWAQRWRVEETARRICVANAEFYPNVNLVGAYGFQAIDPNPWLVKDGLYGFAFGPAVHLPLFKGGALIATRNVRVAQYNAAVADYDASVITASKEVFKGISDVKLTTERYKIVKEAEDLNKDNVEQSKILQGRTITSRLDVLNAENDLIQATDNRLVVLQEVLQARLELIHALGGGFDVPCED